MISEFLEFIAATVATLVAIVKGMEYLSKALYAKPLQFFVKKTPDFVIWLGRKLEEQADSKGICTDTKLENPSYFSAFLLSFISAGLLVMVGLYSVLVILNPQLPFLSYMGMMFAIIFLIYCAQFYRAEAMRQIYVH